MKKIFFLFAVLIVGFLPSASAQVKDLLKKEPAKDTLAISISAGFVLAPQAKYQIGDTLPPALVVPTPLFGTVSFAIGKVAVTIPYNFANNSVGCLAQYSVSTSVALYAVGFKGLHKQSGGYAGTGIFYNIGKQSLFLEIGSPLQENVGLRPTLFTGVIIPFQLELKK